MIEFRLLGPLEVWSAGGALPLGAPKQRALLAVLLLHANRVVSRERLIDELWGEAPPESAPKAIQVYVSQLRKLLPEGTLVTRPPGYVLEVDADAVDLQRFQRLVADARHADPASAAALLSEALALWRGPALTGLGDEPFARAEAGRLDDLRVAAVEERVEADLALGRDAELVGELEALVAEHPRRERLRAQLMLTLYRAGRQADALDAFRAARDALDEIGLEPGAALRRLERQVLAQDSALDLPRERTVAASTVLPGALAPAPPFPFVGRAAELASLRSLLERAEGGEGGVALIGGEAGAGKTRLVRELAAEAAARGVLVLYGASDAAVSTPYEPPRAWLEGLLRVSDRDALAGCLGDRGEILARLVPEVTELTGAPAASPGKPDEDRYALQSSLTELLRCVSRLQPLLLVADDLHWADAGTLHLMRRLSRTAPEARLLLLGAFRDRGEELEPALADTLADLARLDAVTRLTLGSLSDDDVAAFIRATAGPPADPELATTIGELTEGTPLLLCELWRDLRENGVVEVSASGVRLVRPAAELQGPEEVRELVQHRLSRLAPATTELLEQAAVVGPRFERRVIAGAAGVESPALAGALAEAVRSAFLEELREAEPSYRFSHELVRRAVYDGIPVLRRAELHLRAGEALERVHADDSARVLPELAYHFTRAVPVGGAERAVEYDLRAGEAALTAFAFEEAAECLSVALGLGIADPRERARVQVELAYLLRETGRVAEAEAMLAASVEAETGPEERGHAAHVLVQRLYHEMWDPLVDPAHVRARAEEALATFAELGDSRGLAIAGRVFALNARRQGRVLDALAALERALVHAEASGEPRRAVAGSLAMALLDGPTPVGDGIARCEELLRGSTGDVVFEAIVNRCLSALLAMAGQVDAARELVGRSTVVIESAGLRDTASSAVHRRAAAEARELIGDSAGAERELTAAWEWFRTLRGPEPDVRAMHLVYDLALLYCDQGRWDEAERCLEYGREVPELGSYRYELVARVGADARLAAHRGALAEALTLAEHAVELAEQSERLNVRARMWRTLAEVRTLAGRTDEADAALAAALALYEAKGNLTAAARLRTTSPALSSAGGP